jgi:hypothetical protein
VTRVAGPAALLAALADATQPSFPEPVAIQSSEPDVTPPSSYALQAKDAIPASAQASLHAIPCEVPVSIPHVFLDAVRSSSYAILSAAPFAIQHESPELAWTRFWVRPSPSLHSAMWLPFAIPSAAAPSFELPTEYPWSSIRLKAVTRLSIPSSPQAIPPVLPDEIRFWQSPAYAIPLLNYDASPSPVTRCATLKNVPLSIAYSSRAAPLRFWLPHPLWLCLPGPHLLYDQPPHFLLSTPPAGS